MRTKRLIVLVLSIFLKTSLLFPNYSCLDLISNLKPESRTHRSICDNQDKYLNNKRLQEARELRINTAYSKSYAIEVVQKMSLAEIINYFCNTNLSRLFECYYLYHIPNYRDYIRSLPGYEDFILELYEKLENNYSFRKSLRYIDGFDGKYGFKDFVSREARRIRSEQAEREARRQEALRKQRLEEERITQEAQHALIIDHTDTLLDLRDKCSKQLEIFQESCDQELLDRYHQRIIALNKTIKSNGKFFDYSKAVESYRFTDPYRIPFKHRCGTALDKQLHQELCATRAEIVELLVSHRDNFQIQDLYRVVNYFTALAKEEQNPVIAFNLSDFTYYLVKAAQGFGRATEIVFKGTMRGAKNLFKHNLAFCQALVTHPIDDIVKPLAQAGIALGQALYEGVSVAINNPYACPQKALLLTKGLADVVVKDPEKALATVVELFLSFKATSVLKLKNIQGLTRFFSQQERLIKCLRTYPEIVEKITVPIKHVLFEAVELVNVGIEHGKNAMKNLINVVREQPEVIAIGDIAALKLGPECYKDVAKLSKEIVERCEKVRGSQFVKQTKKQLFKSKVSYEALIREHEAKLAAYIRNPDKYDHLGVLKNVSSKIRQKIIKGRVSELQRQIKRQKKDLYTINDLLP